MYKGIQPYLQVQATLAAVVGSTSTLPLLPKLLVLVDMVVFPCTSIQ